MKTDKKFKLSKESATQEFNRIIEEFNFNISTEAKERIVTMKINNIDMQTSQDSVDADYFINKIMTGRISFDEDRKKIIYNLSETISTSNGEMKIDKLEFGKVTRNLQKNIKVENEKGQMVKVNLNEINFGTMPDDKIDAVLMAMTGVSDDEIFGQLEIQDINDLRMVAGYFFN